jgi:hypothetical protein
MRASIEGGNIFAKPSMLVSIYSPSTMRPMLLSWPSSDAWPYSTATTSFALSAKWAPNTFSVSVLYDAMFYSHVWCTRAAAHNHPLGDAAAACAVLFILCMLRKFACAGCNGFLRPAVQNANLHPDLEHLDLRPVLFLALCSPESWLVIERK